MSQQKSVKANALAADADYWDKQAELSHREDLANAKLAVTEGVSLEDFVAGALDVPRNPTDDEIADLPVLDMDAFERSLKKPQ